MPTNSSILRRVAFLCDFGNKLRSDAATAKLLGPNPVPEPAVSAIIGAFDKYEVVGMGEAHGGKDQDDFILTLIRNPAFLEKVNDIAVECGNSLYQAVLDRYIGGADIPLTEVRKV